MFLSIGAKPETEDVKVETPLLILWAIPVDMKCFNYMTLYFILSANISGLFTKTTKMPIVHCIQQGWFLEVYIGGDNFVT